MNGRNRGKLSFTMAMVNLVVMGVWIAALLLLFPWKKYDSQWIVVYPNFIAGIVFGLVSYGLSLIYLLTGRKRTEGADLEVNALIVPFVVIYWLVQGALNFVYAYIQQPTLNKLMLVINLITIVIFAFLIVGSDAHAARVAQDKRIMQGKTSLISHISRQLGETLALANDPKLRKELLFLKEMVDNSNNYSQFRTEQKERLFINQVDNIHQLFLQNCSKEMISEAIRQAGATWKMRNANQ